MKQHKWIAAPLALTLGVTSMALAQPALNQGAGQNPPNNPVGGNRPNFRDMTPEQREAAMTQMREQRVRRTLEGSGFTDRRVQDAVVAYSNAQTIAREDLQTQAQQLIEAVSTKDTPEATIATLLKNFQDSVAAEKERRKIASADLDTKVRFSTQPRLNALLTTMGLVGDESLSAGGRGGFGGFGGGFGGGRGN